MLFKTFGDIQNKKVLLIHGMAMEGANYYQFEKLLPDYYLIIPTLDGHYAENKTAFVSLHDQVDTILRYLNENNIGALYCIAGTSLGALTAFEIFKRQSVKIQKVIFDGGPFFNYNYFQQCIFEAICRFLVFAVKVTRGNFLFPKSLSGIQSTVVRYSRFATKADIKNIAHSIFNLEIPVPFNDTNAEIVFLYGGRENALKSMRRFQGLAGYRLIIKENLGHCQFLVNFPEEYAALIRS